MTRVRFLDQLPAGDAIILRGGGDPPLRIRALAMLPGRSGVNRRSDLTNARALLRGLTAVYNKTKKK
jgi:hypothetical protein